MRGQRWGRVGASAEHRSGLVPALQITRRELQENLKEGARGTTGRGALVRNALVVSQVSLALVALVGALLFVRSFTNLDGYKVGFDTSSVLTLRVFMSGETYEPTGAKGRRVDDIVGRVAALPGVRAAFATNRVPISGGGGDAEIIIRYGDLKWSKVSPVPAAVNRKALCWDDLLCTSAVPGEGVVGES